MSSPIWMPFYVRDYLADTGNLSTLDHGAYLLLILHYWQHGGLPNDDEDLAVIARVTGDEWSRLRRRLVKFFQKGWRHKRIDAELSKSREIIQKRKVAGAAGAAALHGTRMANAMANATDLPEQTHAQSQSPSSSSKKKRRSVIVPASARETDATLEASRRSRATNGSGTGKQRTPEMDRADFEYAMAEMKADQKRREDYVRQKREAEAEAARTGGTVYANGITVEVRPPGWRRFMGDVQETVLQPVEGRRSAA